MTEASKQDVVIEPGTASDNARLLLRRVGIVVIIVGLLDVLTMIIVVSRGERYSSSENIFAIIAGFILVGGGLGPVRAIRFTAGLTAGLTPFGLMAFALEPSSLLSTEVRLGDYGRLVGLVTTLAYFILALWVYRSLYSTSIEIALREKFGQPRWSDRPWWSLAAALAIGVGLATSVFFDRPNIDIAMGAARQHYGPAFQYAMTNYNRQNQNLYVGVEAYTDDIIHRMVVEVVNRRVEKIVDAR